MIGDGLNFYRGLKRFERRPANLLGYRMPERERRALPED